jgi:hypothetical protein
MALPCIPNFFVLVFDTLNDQTQPFALHDNNLIANFQNPFACGGPGFTVDID